MPSTDLEPRLRRLGGWLQDQLQRPYPHYSLVFGLLGGAAFATVYSLWVIFIFLARGGARFTELGTTLPILVATYWAGWLASGVLVGLALPIARWILGSAVLGFMGMFPVWFFVGITQSPLIQNLRTSAMFGAAFGIPIGVGFWFQYGRKRH